MMMTRMKLNLSRELSVSHCKDLKMRNENETTMGSCEDSMLLLKSGPKDHLMIHVTVKVEL